MIETAINAVVVMTGILGGWLLVQAAWRRTFAGDLAEQPTSCAGWGCLSCQDQGRCRDEVIKDNSKESEPGGERNAITRS